MDFIVLFILSRVRRFSTTYLRNFISATIGALWAVAAFITRGNVRVIVNVCTYTLIAYLMVKIMASKDDFIENIKSVVTMYGITFLLSGCIHAVYYYTYAGFWLENYILSDTTLFLIVSISLIAVTIIVNELLKCKQYEQSRVSVLLVIAGLKINLKGIVDTGNVLIDPIYNMPVSIVQKNCLPMAVIQGNMDSLKYHIIPFRSLGCENGLVEVVMSDEMYILRDKKKMKVEHALIGITDMELTKDMQFQMLVNNAYK